MGRRDCLTSAPSEQSVLRPSLTPSPSPAGARLSRQSTRPSAFARSVHGQQKSSAVSNASRSTSNGRHGNSQSGMRTQCRGQGWHSTSVLTMMQRRISLSTARVPFASAISHLVSCAAVHFAHMDDGGGGCVGWQAGKLPAGKYGHGRCEDDKLCTLHRAYAVAARAARAAVETGKPSISEMPVRG